MVIAAKNVRAYFVFIDSIALPFVVVRFVETLFLDKVAYVEVLERDRRFLGQKLGVGCLSSARSASDDDDGTL